METARVRVEDLREPIEQVALATGYRDPGCIRGAFIRALGQPPQALDRECTRDWDQYRVRSTLANLRHSNSEPRLIAPEAIT